MSPNAIDQIHTTPQLASIDIALCDDPARWDQYSPPARPSQWLSAIMAKYASARLYRMLHDRFPGAKISICASTYDHIDISGDDEQMIDQTYETICHLRDQIYRDVVVQYADRIEDERRQPTDSAGHCVCCGWYTKARVGDLCRVCAQRLVDNGANTNGAHRTQETLP